MAAQPIGVDTTAATSPDPIELQMQAVNCLARVKACLLADEPMYLIALTTLAEATQAVEALTALESGSVH